MGHDGAAGAAAVHQCGGYVLAEDESTCVVWGMPRAVFERGVADRVVPLDGMAEAIVSAIGARTAGVR
jgi:two-component system chemotaxis response regulator CheB